MNQNYSSDKINRLNLNTIDELCLKLGYSEECLKEILRQRRNYYYKRKKKKPSGKIRKFLVPTGDLKKIQKVIDNKLLKNIPHSNAAHGSVKGRCPVTNASVHIGKKLVGKFDIKDFFPSIHPPKVCDLFKRLGCSHRIASILTKLTTYKYQLPQGAPTSPAIANLVLSNLDPRLEKLCAKHKLSYTRYMDDITISGSHRICELKRLFCKIVLQEGFLVSTDKTEFQDCRERQEVTGIVTNQNLNIPREKRKKLRAVIHNCKTYGPSSQTKSGESVEDFKKRISGEVNWILQVNPIAGKKLKTASNEIRWHPGHCSS